MGQLSLDAKCSRQHEFETLETISNVLQDLKCLAERANQLGLADSIGLFLEQLNLETVSTKNDVYDAKGANRVIKQYSSRS